MFFFTCFLKASNVSRAFSALKVEEVYRKKNRNLKEARENLFAYIEVFYIMKRWSDSLGYLTPAEFLEKHAGQVSVQTGNISPSSGQGLAER